MMNQATIVSRTGLVTNILTILVLGLLTGCTTAPTKQAEDDPQKAVQQASNNYLKTVGQGALVGGVAGALVGKMIGGDNGMALGAAAGAALGGLAGHFVSKSQDTFASRERRIANMEASLQEDNQSLGEFIQLVQGALDDAKVKVDQLNRQLASREIDAGDKTLRLVELRRSRDKIAKSLESMRTNRDDFQERYIKLAQEDTMDIGTLKQDLQDYTDKVANLEQQLQEFDDVLEIGSTAGSAS